MPNGFFILFFVGLVALIRIHTYNLICQDAVPVCHVIYHYHLMFYSNSQHTIPPSRSSEMTTVVNLHQASISCRGKLFFPCYSRCYLLIMRERAQGCYRTTRLSSQKRILRASFIRRVIRDEPNSKMGISEQNSLLRWLTMGSIDVGPRYISGKVEESFCLCIISLTNQEHPADLF